MRIDVYNFKPPNRTAYMWGIALDKDRIVALLFLVEGEEVYVATGSDEFIRVSNIFQEEFSQAFGDLLTGLKEEVEFKGFRMRLIGVVPKGVPSSAFVFTREKGERVFVLLLEDMGLAIYGAKDRKDVVDIAMELRRFIGGIMEVRDDSQIH